MGAAGSRLRARELVCVTLLKFMVAVKHKSSAARDKLWRPSDNVSVPADKLSVLAHNVSVLADKLSDRRLNYPRLKISYGYDRMIHGEIAISLGCSEILYGALAKNVGSIVKNYPQVSNELLSPAFLVSAFSVSSLGICENREAQNQPCDEW